MIRKTLLIEAIRAAPMAFATDILVSEVINTSVIKKYRKNNRDRYIFSTYTARNHVASRKRSLQQHGSDEVLAQRIAQS